MAIALERRYELIMDHYNNLTSQAEPLLLQQSLNGHELNDTGTSSELFVSLAEARHFEAIRQWIYTNTGLHYPERKYPTLYHRLMKLCRQLELDDLAALDQALQNKTIPNLAVKIACVVSTNHTFFFREQDIFKFLQEQIMPTLPVTETWRIWSAACSTGDETYTLAMVLADALGLSTASQRVQILGTDISQTALEQAEYGIYNQRRLEQVPPLMRRQQYFHLMGLDQWRVSPSVRQMCTFRRLNLMSEPWPFKNRFHVTFCRNVLYYFDRSDQARLVERLYDVTAPGGWLITSVTESVRSLNTRWQILKTGIHRKVE